MKWTVIRLVIWIAIIGFTEYLFLNFDSYIFGFSFLLGTNILYVVILQIKMFFDLFSKNRRSGLRRVFNLNTLHHLFWTLSLFLTLFLFFVFPYLDPVLLDHGIDLVEFFPDLEYPKSIAKDFLLIVNAAYIVFLLIKLLFYFFRRNKKKDEQQPPVPITKPEAQYIQPEYCASCNADLEPGDRFCPLCGSNVLSQKSGVH